ncbi:hypothetical protein Marpi_1190 [Marinitoga piezophila KA3]|uniref:Uncharacterized protein n=1 Tax=Marinitoga piezophila (strain DSM 14283 / JCM 11233 / KA3) TaxID=443254 RepID=H2J8B4_MARPK|nr:hypothetical protein [Marinitoga piezophila]AEX85598.1 hypothetical protein Marpi_1190 [Marinitoga piezophila KA3]
MKKKIYFLILIIILLSPYLKYGFRIDQLLIPIFSIYLLILHRKIDKKFGCIVFGALNISIFFPLFSTLLNLNNSELYMINFSNFIKEAQNILKPFFIFFLDILG